MYKFAWLDFDSKDKNEPFAISYNNFSDKSGDFFVLWFESEADRQKQIDLDIKKGVIYK